MGIFRGLGASPNRILVHTLSMNIDNAFENIHTTTELIDAGMTLADVRQRVRSGRFLRVRRGAYTDPQWWTGLPPWDRHLCQAAAYYKMRRTPVVFSHQTAAALLGISGSATPKRLHLMYPAGKGTSSPDVAVHQPSPEAKTSELTCGITVTNVVQTLTDCARTLPVHEALISVEKALYLERRGELIWEGRSLFEDLRTSLNDVRGRGAVSARTVAARMSPFSESPGETLGRNLMWVKGLALPVQQYLIGMYRVDFAWPEQKIILEFDGLKKYATADDLRAEKLRQQYLEEQGWTVVRTTWEEVRDRPDSLIGRLLRAGVPLRPQPWQ